MNGHGDVVTLLLTAGAHVDTRDAAGRTALMEAAMRSHLEVMGALLGAGAQVDLAAALGETALILAQWSGPRHGAAPARAPRQSKIADRDKKTALMWLVDLQFHRGGVPTDVIQPLVAGGAEANARDTFGRTALMWAVTGDLSSSVRPPVLQALLDNGADVNVKDDRGETALFGLVRYIDDALALDDGRECLDVLLAAGADPKGRNKDGKTPLGIVDPRNTIVIKLLKDLGFNEPGTAGLVSRRRGVMAAVLVAAGIGGAWAMADRPEPGQTVRVEAPVSQPDPSTPPGPNAADVIRALTDPTTGLRLCPAPAAELIDEQKQMLDSVLSTLPLPTTVPGYEPPVVNVHRPLVPC